MTNRAADLGYLLARTLSLFIAAAMLSACATLPQTTNRVTSTTHVVAQGRVAQLLQPYRNKQPDKSGFLILDRGDQAYSARIAMVNLAQESLSAQYFIWQRDASGTVLGQAILDAADRGVRIRLLLDDLTAKGRDWQLLAFDAHPNIEIRLFNPFGNRAAWQRLRRSGEFVLRASRLNHRMHNKIFMVDGQVAIVGGRNIGDEYFGVSREFNFRDMDLLGVGPVVAEVGSAFDSYWNSPWAYPMGDLTRKSASPEVLSKVRGQLSEQLDYGSRIEAILPDDKLTSDSQLQKLAADLIWAEAEVVYDLPEKVTGADLQGRPVSAVTSRLVELSELTQQQLLLQTAYFIPRNDGVEQLAGLVARGVEVKVHTNSLASNNHATAHSGYRRYRKRLLQAGVKMFELSPTALISDSHNFSGNPKASLGLHSKTAVFDRSVVFVGTLNLDPRSIVLNTEMGLIVHSATLAERIANAIEADMAVENSWQVSLEAKDRMRWTMQRQGVAETRKREPEASFVQKLLSWIAALLPVESQL